MAIVITMPVFGQKDVTKLTLDYARRAQKTIPNSHILIWDNGSPDGTSEWLRGYVQREELFYSPVNLGAPKARNLMFRMAFEQLNASAVIILDNDVVGHPEAMANLVAFWLANPNFWMVTGREVGTKLEDLDTIKLFDNSRPIGHPRWCFALLPLSTWKIVGPQDEAYGFYGYNDIDYFDRICITHDSPIWCTALAPFIHLHGSHGSWLTDPSVLYGIVAAKRYYISKWEALGRDMSAYKKPGQAWSDWEKRLDDGSATMEELVQEAIGIRESLLRRSLV